MYLKTLSSYSLALLFDEKIRQSAAPFWFGLRVVGVLQGKLIRSLVWNIS
jgi:hypothetical protein